MQEGPLDATLSGWGASLEDAERGCLPIEGQFVALDEVGTVIGAQGGLMLTVTACRFLYLAIGIQQALLAWPSLGPTAPEGSKEAVASLAEVGREEGVQLLPARERKWVVMVHPGVKVPCSQGRQSLAGGRT